MIYMLRGREERYIASTVLGYQGQLVIQSPFLGLLECARRRHDEMTRFLAAGENYRVVMSPALAETVCPYAQSHRGPADGETRGTRLPRLMATSQRDLVSFLKETFHSDYRLFDSCYARATDCRQCKMYKLVFIPT